MLVLGVACSTGDKSEPVAVPTGNTAKLVRVATYNVHNLFDTVCDSGACASGDYEKQQSESAYVTKVNSIVGGIWAIDADVILLQEIEKETCLRAIQDGLGAKRYPGAVFGDIGRTASVNVAILTRGTVTDVQTHREGHWLTQPDGTTKLLSRELLQVEITLPNGVEMTAFTTHFVSKATDSIGDRRLAEAKFTHDVLADYIAAHPGRLVVFGGDLNDTPDSPPIQALEADGALVRTTRDMPQNAILTWGNQAAFDHLYYPAAFTGNYKETTILCDNENHNGYSSSDHCAVRADFEIE